ncbi:unnamed protein product [Rangifer tarandus platyrhynchus]|uniref:Secreted protein n=2 Tax=Rangifer tarandus platyrhynchus TaxID=3082113 RepID=A0ABN8Y3C4_RANTA|nr:unnamed protein product [Rangifer tarandus platyrhynchus]
MRPSPFLLRSTQDKGSWLFLFLQVWASLSGCQNFGQKWDVEAEPSPISCVSKVKGLGCWCCYVASVVPDSVQPHRRQPTKAPLSLGFSRQEHWSGLPFPSAMHESEK